MPAAIKKKVKKEKAMFKEAVKNTMQFTRPILFITRTYGSGIVTPGLATMFFVNDKGAALTCKHVANQLLASTKVNRNYNEFKKEAGLSEGGTPVSKKDLRALEGKYHISQNSVVNIKCQFKNCVMPLSGFKVTPHPEYDLALIEFQGFEQLCYKPDNIYLLEDAAEIAPGMSVCRLGFPFPEFTNFKYDSEKDDIVWTKEAAHVPAFPIDGIITRHMGDQKGRLFGLEVSTPGLRGQSGGPLFDTQGRILGLQFATKHLHLGFDMINAEVLVNGQKKTVNNQPFLHVGSCIHINVIKKFLDEHGIPYKTA